MDQGIERKFKEKMKYIIFNRSGLEVPLIFPTTVNHIEIAQRIGMVFKVVSAGQCSVGNDGKIYCWGESISLKVKSREEDTEIINRIMENY